MGVLCVYKEIQGNITVHHKRDYKVIEDKFVEFRKEKSETLSEFASIFFNKRHHHHHSIK